MKPEIKSQIIAKMLGGSAPSDKPQGKATAVVYEDRIEVRIPAESLTEEYENIKEGSLVDADVVLKNIDKTGATLCIYTDELDEHQDPNESSENE